VPRKKLARFAILGVVFLIIAAVITECDEVPDTGTAKPAPRTAVQPGTGVVRGRATFNGPRPEPKVVGGECCPGAAPAVDESVIVSDDGGLKNVVVYIKDGPLVRKPPATQPAAIAVLDQKDCRYVPHVIAMQTGEPLDVTSHDPTMHNVHVQSVVNPAANFSETAVGASHQITFAAPEFIRVKCDVHPWMTAYIAVFDHNCFAVTGDDGRFQIDSLPPGIYTLVARHERYGSLERQFTVTGDQPVNVQFDFRGP